MKIGGVILIGLGAGALLGTISVLTYKKLKGITATANTNTTPQKFSILFIGDSNTAANFSYADQLQKQFPNIIVKKLAKPSMKTDWMLQQLKDELSKNKYSVVSILGGSNDIYALGRIDTAEANLNAMYTMAHSNGAKVIAVTPPNHSFYVNATPQKLALQDQLNAWIKGNQNKDYFIDFTNITNNKSFFSSADGYQHAQAPAHKILAQNVIEQLNLSNKT